MTDEPAAQQPAQRPVFDRVFPGPAPQDPRFQSRLDAITRVAEQRKQRAEQHRARRESGMSDGTAVPSVPSASASADDLAQLRDAVHEQTDVLRALLDADVAIRDDARATTQNSRTFAIAGTVIAFFTMVAAVVTVVIAVAPH